MRDEGSRGHVVLALQFCASLASIPRTYARSRPRRSSSATDMLAARVFRCASAPGYRAPASPGTASAHSIRSRSCRCRSSTCAQVERLGEASRSWSSVRPKSCRAAVNGPRGAFADVGRHHQRSAPRRCPAGPRRSRRDGPSRSCRAWRCPGGSGRRTPVRRRASRQAGTGRRLAMTDEAQRLQDRAHQRADARNRRRRPARCGARRR